MHSELQLWFKVDLQRIESDDACVCAISFYISIRFDFNSNVLNNAKNGKGYADDANLFQPALITDEQRGRRTFTSRHMNKHFLQLKTQQQRHIL